MDQNLNFKILKSKIIENQTINSFRKEAVIDFFDSIL